MRWYRSRYRLLPCFSRFSDWSPHRSNLPRFLDPLTSPSLYLQSKASFRSWFGSSSPRFIFPPSSLHFPRCQAVNGKMKERNGRNGRQRAQFVRAATRSIWAGSRYTWLGMRSIGWGRNLMWCGKDRFGSGEARFSRKRPTETAMNSNREVACLIWVQLAQFFSRCGGGSSWQRRSEQIAESLTNRAAAGKTRARERERLTGEIYSSSSRKRLGKEHGWEDQPAERARERWRPVFSLSITRYKPNNESFALHFFKSRRYQFD